MRVVKVNRRVVGGGCGWWCFDSVVPETRHGCFLVFSCSFFFVGTTRGWKKGWFCTVCVVSIALHGLHPRSLPPRLEDALVSCSPPPGLTSDGRLTFYTPTHSCTSTSCMSLSSLSNPINAKKKPVWKLCDRLPHAHGIRNEERLGTTKRFILWGDHVVPVTIPENMEEASCLLSDVQAQSESTLAGTVHRSRILS
jgi:hypothetical protein